MSAQHTPGPMLLHRARIAAQAIATGPFTPIVLEPYGPLIGGERGWRLGYPSETVEGRGCIVWDSKATGSTS